MNDVSPSSGLASLRRSLRSWRTAAVVLLSFSSGLPLGLVWYAIPDWMRDIGVDIRVVGILTLAQAPWAFKVLWSPLMDRYVPPFWGRRRGWMAISQVALVACGLLLAGVGSHPDAIWVVGAIALATAMASASQDIAYDAYTVDVLRPEEQGAAAGARTALYRAAMAVSGGAAITAAAQWGWPFVNLLLATLYLPMLVLTWKAPEPEYVRPPATLRDAVWHPFLELLSRPRAVEILAFVVLYKFADQLAQALTRPFLIDMGYNAYHRGVALATVGLVGTVGGALIGGWVTTIGGLGRSLWIFGVLQIFSNLGYFLLARANGPNLPLMYAATSFELFTSGLGTGAFSVRLLRLTKRFPRRDALFSSLFALPFCRRTDDWLCGPCHRLAGFYLATMVIGIPGLVMLALRPPGVSDPQFASDDKDVPSGTMPATNLVTRGLAGAIASGACALVIVVLLAGLQNWTSTPERGMDLSSALAAIVRPASATDWIQLAGIVAVAAVGGLFVAAGCITGSSPG